MFVFIIGIDYHRSIFEWNYLGRNLLCMTIQAVVFFTFNLMLHYQVFSKCLHQYSKIQVRSITNIISFVGLFEIFQSYGPIYCSN